MVPPIKKSYKNGAWNMSELQLFTNLHSYWQNAVGIVLMRLPPPPPTPQKGLQLVCRPAW